MIAAKSVIRRGPFADSDFLVTLSGRFEPALVGENQAMKKFKMTLASLIVVVISQRGALDCKRMLVEIIDERGSRVYRSEVVGYMIQEEIPMPQEGGDTGWPDLPPDASEDEPLESNILARSLFENHRALEGAGSLLAAPLCGAFRKRARTLSRGNAWSFGQLKYRS